MEPVYYEVGHAPGLRGYVEPGLGKGSLRFYADAGDHTLGSLEFTFVAAQPWHETGWQPFAWDMLLPAGERGWPLIRLVLGRSVGVVMKVHAATRASPLYHYAELTAFGPRTPEIQTFRPQDDSLIPQPDDKLEPFRFMPQPFRIGPTGVWMPSKITGGVLVPPSSRRVNSGRGIDPRWGNLAHEVDIDELFTVDVVTRPLGVEIRNMHGQYGITIDASGDTYPAGLNRVAHAYELLLTESAARPPTLRIVHTDGVRIEATAARDAFLLNVEAARVNSTDEVPAQGESLDGGFDFKPVDIKVAPKQRPLWLNLLEAAIGFVPYVGALYYAAELAYSAITGHDFFGYQVSEEELWVMGVACLLPYALPKPQLTIIQREMKLSPLARVLDGAVASRLLPAMEGELIGAVGKIGVPDATRLAQLVTQFVSRQRTAAEVLEAFHRLVGEAYLRELDQVALRRALTADFQSFRNATLASGFNQYAAKKARNLTAARNLIEWALRQGPRSRYAIELERELGADWRMILGRNRDNPLLNPLRSSEIVHYDRLAGRLEDYASLAKANAGHGEFFEIDHVLEQRFWRNDPRITSAFDEKGQGMAMIVPRNPAVAARMPGKPIFYVHTTKTRMLVDLIPNGREAEFTAQQIWDAHAFTLTALKVDRSVLLNERVLDNFSMLARARGERIDFRLLSDDLFDYFFSPPRWPSLQ